MGRRPPRSPRSSRVPETARWRACARPRSATARSARSSKPAEPHLAACVLFASAAAKDANASRELARRVAARATREASSRGFGAGGAAAWSRALWADLASLAGPHGALAEHLTREDAAAELLRAQLRVGDGAERTVAARRVLAGLQRGRGGDERGDGGDGSRAGNGAGNGAGTGAGTGAGAGAGTGADAAATGRAGGGAESFFSW